MVDSRIQLADVQAVAGVLGTRMQLADLIAKSGVPGSRMQLADLEALIDTAGGRMQLADIEAKATVLNALQARPGAGQIVFPFTDVVVDGSASTGTMTNVTWAQIQNGSPVISTAPFSGLINSYRPPPALFAYDLIFELTITDGTQTSSARRTDKVMPCEAWTAVGGVFIPVPQYDLSGIPRAAGVEPVTGVPASFSTTVGSPVSLTMTAGDPDGAVTGFWWKPTAWPGPGVAPVLLTPDQPTTLSTPLSSPGVYVFQATATGSCGLTSAPKTTTVTVT